ncbi:hypothetical protein Acid345_3393 [Candidatus Koribacter versatilis Ellin345]|uniref:Uncharacterized protein n=1 Tax=Koribacter versatilis (strain Ellin345) TaxID=204669 RepID=Q1IL56_KORVE|nr:hypothetical protein [Candidatus Koribacter versatilis]ABF42394.1 hypothetical protein Acid345_3393 [Candidatus Koribacter versatilis Ellin345]
MASCRFCGKKAGLFKHEHEECALDHSEAMRNFPLSIETALTSGKTIAEAGSGLDEIAEKGRLTSTEKWQLFTEVWNRVVRVIAMESPLSPDQYSALEHFYNESKMSADAVQSTAGGRAAILSFLLWTVYHDQIDPYRGPVNFNTKDDEVAVFGMANIYLLEERAQRVSNSVYGGLSLPIGHGIYYHMGRGQSQSVSVQVLKEIDYGDILITTKRLYFGGTSKSFAIEHKKALRFEPFSDGVGISATGKPKILRCAAFDDCGWFLYNLLTALAARESKPREVKNVLPIRVKAQSEGGA